MYFPRYAALKTFKTINCINDTIKCEEKGKILTRNSCRGNKVEFVDIYVCIWRVNWRVSIYKRFFEYILSVDAVHRRNDIHLSMHVVNKKIYNPTL